MRNFSLISLSSRIFLIERHNTEIEVEIFPPEYPYGEYLVTIIVEQEWKHRYHYFVYDMYLHDQYDIGLVLDFIEKKETIYVIVSPINPAGTVDYKVSAISFKNPFKWH